MNSHRIINVVLFILTIQCWSQAQDIQWTRKADLPTGRWMGGAVALNDRVYVMGGCDADFNPVKSVWCGEMTEGH
ncbi:hypothetical protein ACFL3F_03035 [Planctomycetota bacterium]